MFTKKYLMVKFILLSLVAWKIWVFVFLLLAIVFVPLRLHFLGGGLEHYLRIPYFWAWANFDGEHYLSIAQHGYGQGERAFFPLYPLLMRLFVWPWRGDLFFLQIAGLFISHVAFFLALLGLWKLIRLDFKRGIAQITILLLLFFPTSFYFGSIYTESLFLALSVWAFYAARRGWWLLTGILGGLASATRFVGIVLFPAMLVEWWIHNKVKSEKLKVRSFLPLLIVPLGLLFYMYYLQKTTGDPFAFLHTLTWFGEQRSATPILLPQVFWRYFKISMDLKWQDPFFFTFLLEATTAVLFLVAGIIAFLKLRFSYAVFLIFSYLAPTFSGSFSSLPRYAIVLFPAFILGAIFLYKKPLWAKFCAAVLLFILLGVATALFVRGYWIA